MRINISILLSSMMASTTLLGANEGVLIVAHGTSGHHLAAEGCPTGHQSEWDHRVLSAVEEASTSTAVPVELAFGMWSTDCYDEKISELSRRLEAAGESLERLVVIPLFISSHSPVVDAQRFIFRGSETNPLPIPLRKVAYSGAISYLSAIDYHPTISRIVRARAQELLSQARTLQSELILVMHGPISDTDNHHWMILGHEYAKDIADLTGIKYTHVLSLKDDDRGEGRERATAELRRLVTESQRSGRDPLILPLLLSPGGIEGGIRTRLDGLSYGWTGHVLLPDSLFVEYLRQRLAEVNW